MPILYKIKAYLYDNFLTKDNPNDFIARTVSERSLSVKQICESAANRGGADVSAAAMEHGTELFLKDGIPAMRWLLGKHRVFHCRNSNSWSIR